MNILVVRIFLGFYNFTTVLDLTLIVKIILTLSKIQNIFAQKLFLYLFI